MGDEMGRPVRSRLALRNVLILAAAGAVGGSGAAINIGISGLAGQSLLSGDRSLATLPITTFVIGTACGTFPAAMLMRRIGRRAGFISGLLVGVAGGIVNAAAMAMELFWLLCLGTFMMGFAAAFVQQFRFAAADTASPDFRPKAISWVMAGGVAAAFIAPQTAIHTTDLLPNIPFAGTYLAASVLLSISALIVSNIKIPKPKPRERANRGRPLAQIAAQPAFLTAVGCSISAYALMSLVMTAAPLAMIACGHTQTDALLGIQWHVIAMFAPSLITGHLIAWVGARQIVAIGLVLLMGSAIIGMTGISVAHFWAVLVMLGIGWNFGFVGGTTLVAETYHPEEKEKVQGLNDLLVFTVVALASLFSGKILATWGWSAITPFAIPIPLVCLGALAWQSIRRQSIEVSKV